MKKLKIVLSTLVILIAISSNSSGQSTSQSLIDDFFNDYETEGAKVAVENIYKTNPWTSRIADDVENVKNSLASFNDELVGKYYGYVFIDKIETSDCFSIYTYFIKFDRLPLRLTFKFYKPDDKWTLFSFKFDDEFDDDFEQALIWKYSMKE